MVGKSWNFKFGRLLYHLIYWFISFVDSSLILDYRCLQESIESYNFPQTCKISYLRTLLQSRSWISDLVPIPSCTDEATYSQGVTWSHLRWGGTVAAFLLSSLLTEPCSLPYSSRERAHFCRVSNSTLLASDWLRNARYYSVLSKGLTKESRRPGELALRDKKRNTPFGMLWTAAAVRSHKVSQAKRGAKFTGSTEMERSCVLIDNSTSEWLDQQPPYSWLLVMQGDKCPHCSSQCQLSVSFAKRILTHLLEIEKLKNSIKICCCSFSCFYSC